MTLLLLIGKQNLNQSYQKQLVASLTLGGARRVTVTTALPAGVLSFVGATAKATQKQLPGTLSFSGTQNRGIVKQLASALAFTGAQPARQVTKQMIAALAFTGGMSKGIAKKLSGVLGFLGNLVGQTSGVKLRGSAVALDTALYAVATADGVLGSGATQDTYVGVPSVLTGDVPGTQATDADIQRGSATAADAPKFGPSDADQPGTTVVGADTQPASATAADAALDTPSAADSAGKTSTADQPQTGAATGDSL